MFPSFERLSSVEICVASFIPLPACPAEMVGHPLKEASVAPRSKGCR